MSSAEGWAAQRCGLPAQWYADVEASSGIGFPISADATTIATTIADLYTANGKRTKK